VSSRSSTASADASRPDRLCEAVRAVAAGDTLLARPIARGLSNPAPADEIALSEATSRPT
jgi:DNA-binding NarL/FixJ family response regulator